MKTAEQKKRIANSLKELEVSYNKEMGYSEDLRNPERLDSLISNMDKLEVMLAC